MPNFKGVFDGDNHTVTLDYDELAFNTSKATAFGGLFSSAQEAAIRNLKLAGSVKGTYTAESGLQDIGLLVGYTTPAASGSTTPLLIENVTSDVEVVLTIDVKGTGTAYVGSIVGRGNSAAAPACLTLVNCINNGDITVAYQNAASNTGRAAGLIGHAYNGTVLTNCVNNGDVVHKGDSKFNTGGLLGSGVAVYTGCVQSGNITSDTSSVIPFSGLTADESAGNILQLTVTGNPGQQVRYGTQSVTLDESGTAVFKIPVYQNESGIVENNAFSYEQYLTVNGTRLDWYNLTSTTMTANLSTTGAADLTVPFQSASDALVLTTAEQLLALQKAINEGDTDSIDMLYALGGKAEPADDTAARIALQTAYYRLGSDIDLSQTAGFTGIGSSSFPFGGHFDGQGHTVTYSITQTDCTANRIGLFGQIDSVGGSSPELHDLTVDASINLTYTTRQTTTFLAGGLAGRASNALKMSGIQVNVKGISVAANVIGAEYDTYHIGGVFGQGSVEHADVTISGTITGNGNGSFSASGVTNQGSVRNCAVIFTGEASEISATSSETGSVYAAILGAYIAGGDVSLSDVKICNSTSSPIVVKAVGKGENTGWAGGLFGNVTSATATSDTWLRLDGTVTVEGDFTVTGGAHAGGICGAISNEYSVSVDSYINTMEVSSENGRVGGLFGSIAPGNGEKQVVLHNCLNAGAVSGKNKGGLIGYWNNSGTLALSGCAYLETDGLTAVNSKEDVDIGAAGLDLSVLSGAKSFGDTAELFSGEALPALSIIPADTFPLSDGHVVFGKVGTLQAVLTWNGTPFYTSGDITVEVKALVNDDVTITGVNSSYASDEAAKAALETIEVIYGGKALIKDTDYIVAQDTSSGSHQFTITFTGNYSGTAAAPYSVNDKALAVSAQEHTGVYDGEGHSISIVAPEGVTVTYGESADDLCEINPSYTDAGTYVVYWKAEKNGSTVTGSTVVAITPAVVTIRPSDKTAYVGDTLPVLGENDYTVTGLVGDDSLITVPELSYGNAPDMDTAGTYPIIARGADAGDNYTITYVSGTLTIRSSSSSGGTRHPVNVEGVQNGSVTVSPTSAYMGTTVTIAVKPDSGYKLDELAVTDSKGNQVKVISKGDNQYTFTMPNSKVTVTVRFASQADPDSPDFIDVAPSAYYYDAVIWAVEQGITNGTSATTFSPNASCTRAQMVAFLWRSAGSPKVAGNNPFLDLSPNAYYYDAVMWAVEQGITNGTSATAFSPDAPVTRSQAVTFLYRATGAPAVNSGSSFSDVPADAYYSNAVVWAAAEGITVGTGSNTFSPNADCTRGQIVTFLYRDAK